MVCTQTTWMSIFSNFTQDQPQYRANNYIQLGPIITFHNYNGQDPKRHSHFDTIDGAIESIVPNNLDTFNGIIGARDAIEMSKIFINFYVSKTKWEDGVEAFLSKKVFALDEHPTRSNNEVDEHFGKSYTDVASMEMQSRYEDYEYREGMERKLMMLETGLAHTDHSQHCAVTQPGRFYQWLKKPQGTVLKIVKYVLAFVGLVLAFMVGSLMMKALKLT